MDEVQKEQKKQPKIASLWLVILVGLGYALLVMKWPNQVFTFMSGEAITTTGLVVAAVFNFFLVAILIVALNMRVVMKGDLKQQVPEWLTYILATLLAGGLLVKWQVVGTLWLLVIAIILILQRKNDKLNTEQIKCFVGILVSSIYIFGVLGVLVQGNLTLVKEKILEHPTYYLIESKDIDQEIQTIKATGLSPEKVEKLDEIVQQYKEGNKIRGVKDEKYCLFLSLESDPIVALRIEKEYIVRADVEVPVIRMYQQMPKGSSSSLLFQSLSSVMFNYQIICK